MLHFVITNGSTKRTIRQTRLARQGYCRASLQKMLTIAPSLKLLTSASLLDAFESANVLPLLGPSAAPALNDHDGGASALFCNTKGLPRCGPCTNLMKKCIYGVHMALAVEQKYYTIDDVGLDSVNFDIYTAFTTTPIL